jgi:hypothetical protein
MGRVIKKGYAVIRDVVSSSAWSAFLLVMEA